MAFFHQLYYEVDSILNNYKEKELLHKLLKIVYSDCLFLFGNSFCLGNDNRFALRICDMSLILEDNVRKNGEINATKMIDMQYYLEKSEKYICQNYDYMKDINEYNNNVSSFLASAFNYHINHDTYYKFYDDYHFFYNRFNRLYKNKERYTNYVNSIDSVFTTEFKLTKQIFLDLMQLYKVFFLNTYSNNANRNRKENEINELIKHCEISFEIFGFTTHIHSNCTTNEE